jgi:hypothetical protein
MIPGMQDKAAPDLTACPLIGLERDRWTRFEFPSADHRCWAKKRPEKLALSFQATICLGREFTSCLLYREWKGSKTPAEPESFSPF